MWIQATENPIIIHHLFSNILFTKLQIVIMAAIALKLPNQIFSILSLYLSYFIIIQYLFQTLSLQCTNSNIAATAKCNRTKHCKMIWSLLVPTNIPKLTKQPPGPSLLFCWGAMNNLWSYHLMTSDTEWHQIPLFQNLPGKQFRKKSPVVSHSLAKEHYKLLSL